MRSDFLPISRLILRVRLIAGEHNPLNVQGSSEDITDVAHIILYHITVDSCQPGSVIDGERGGVAGFALNVKAFRIFGFVACFLWAAASGRSAGIEWDALRGHFKLSFDLDPPAAGWSPETRGHSVAGDYHSGDYRLCTENIGLGSNQVLIRYQLTRADGKSFKVSNSRIDCMTSYSGVYKMFSPMTMAQQNYRVDLPFTLTGGCNGLSDEPVIWMQQTDGRNTLAIGMINQLPLTALEGSTYDPGNGGEAPGIANSYVRATSAGQEPASSR